MTTFARWPATWRACWIWTADDGMPTAGGPEQQTVYLRTVVDVPISVEVLSARVSCDSRYLLYVNGEVAGRGPARDTPPHLGWDTVDLAPHLRTGRNCLVALCRYYGVAGPWWIPPESRGVTRGRFALETSPDAAISIHSERHWHARAAPFATGPAVTGFGLGPEIVDGRGIPADLHDPDAATTGWHHAARLTDGDGVPLAPGAPPYDRPVPRETALPGGVTLVLTALSPAEDDHAVAPAPHPGPDPLATWQSNQTPATDTARRITVLDADTITSGHVRLRVTGGGGHRGEAVDLVGGEYLGDDGLPDPAPRHWSARYLLSGNDSDEVVFFEPIGLRYAAVNHPAGVSVTVMVDESLAPRPAGATFECSDPQHTALWHTGLRTVEQCASDTFVDCPGREQRAWVGDTFVASLTWLVTSPDSRLVRHALDVAARSRRADGLLAMAAACDRARSATTIPDFSLQWIRTLAAYWRYTADAAAVADLLPTARGIIERYERFRAGSGLLENVPGWLFLDWAQIERGVTCGAHDALYARTLRDFATLPGAEPVDALIAETARGFERYWDPRRGVYVDRPGGMRVSQHANAAAIAAGIVPADRRQGVLTWVCRPERHGGRLVTTMTEPGIPGQSATPRDFDPVTDVVACEPPFAALVHQAMGQCGRIDLIVDSLRRWWPHLPSGTLPEFFATKRGAVSICHAWSTTPTYDLVTYVLGVRPVEAGYRRVEIDPHLADLSSVSGTIPTPHGWIRVAADRREAVIDLPARVTATVGERTYGAGHHRIPLGEP